MATVDLGSRAEFYSGISLRRARLIKIEPEVGLPIFLTTHSSAIEFEGNLYVVAKGADLSAQSEGTGGQEVDTELSGAIDSDLLTNADLTRGVYRGANVTEYLVDHKFPWVGALRTWKYIIQEISWNGEAFQASCGGIFGSLTNSKGQSWSRQCVAKFGGPYCGVNLEALRQPPGSPATVTLVDSTNPRKFSASQFNAGPGGSDPRYFEFGLIEYRSGDNLGRFSTIVRYNDQGDEFTLAEAPPFEVQVGDTFYATPGCQKTQAACQSFNNYANFQGAPFVRGSSGAVDTPSS